MAPLFSSFSYSKWLLLIIVVFPCVLGFVNFYQEVDVTWGDGRGKIMDNGNLLTLSLDKASGSGFQSKNQYLFGRFDIKIKLVPGNSAGTVTAYYLRSQASLWDEIDFEFLGNLSGQPYIVHTNIYVQGEGNREQQFYLWFDPTVDFHTYSFLWNPARIVFYVDGRPIREFENMEAKGAPYPKKQAMRLYASLWDGEEWATRGGVVKTDWTKAPFTASFRSYNGNGCVWSNAASWCGQNSTPWLSEELDSGSQKVLRWVRKKYMIYDYCTDKKRFPQGLPRECTVRTNP